MLALALAPAPAVGARPAPRAPPLEAGTGLGAGVSPAEEAASSSPSSGGEPLAGNGLSSPLCRDGAEADLTASAASDCRTSGFEAARAPSGDYAFDVHIDTGVTQPTNDAAAIFQNLTQFGWASLVAVVHGLIVMLDWCFTLDLLDSAAMSGLASALRATQATFTQPWLAVMLAIASVLALYNGLIRRRVAETLGEAALMLAMMAGGLWVIANPTGTIGALGAWANEASLGTLGAVMAGTPAHPARTLAESNQRVFNAAIDGPWCYLEFGDVGWCANPARLDPRLRAAALRIAARGGSDAPGRSAELLRSAQTNGELFLALPANGPARNSINLEGSLYNVLCGGSERPCTGPTAAQAEFRTESGTGARVIGMAFIALGLLGMLLVLGFIALRLLAAALISLICLLLTPAAVLAPTLGESGRAAFRTWAVRLLGAVTSKLVFSFLLGAVLETERALASVRLGWWTQWVLISALWWMGFLHRHKALGFAHGERDRQHHSLARRAREALDTPRSVLRHAGQLRHALARPAPDPQRRRRLARAGGERARELADAQAGRTLEREQREARALSGMGPHTQTRLSGMRAQLARIQGARARATATGDTRRAARLGARERLLAAAIAREEDVLARARRTVAGADSAKRRTGQSHTREQREARARFLDAQAALPAAGRADAGGRRRDYAALAGLAGYGREQYARLDPRERRQARAQIDRELALRRELGAAAADVAATAGRGAPRRRDRRTARRELDHTLGERLRAQGHRPPSPLTGNARLEAWKREGATGAQAERPSSPVLDDAREVAAGRKRQLGRDRP